MAPDGTLLVEEGNKHRSNKTMSSKHAMMGYILNHIWYYCFGNSKAFRTGFFFWEGLTKVQCPAKMADSKIMKALQKGKATMEVDFSLDGKTNPSCLRGQPSVQQQAITSCLARGAARGNRASIDFLMLSEAARKIYNRCLSHGLGGAH